MPYCEICRVSCPAEYQMSEHLAGSKHAAQVASASASSNAPMCKCNRRTVERTVYKSGPIQGRKFYSCNSCNFFEFADIDKALSSANIDRLSGTIERIVFSPKTAQTTTERPTNVWPPELAGRWKHSKIRLFAQEERLKIIFSYDVTLINMIKQYVPNRQYEVSDKTWWCPMSSASTALSFFSHLGVEVPPAVQIRADNVAAQVGAISEDDISLSVVNREKVKLDFKYNVDVINAIKKLHPMSRTYSPENKAWVCTIRAFPDLVSLLEDIEYKTQQEAKVDELFEYINNMPAETIPDHNDAQVNSTPVTGETDGTKPKVTATDADWSPTKKARVHVEAARPHVPDDCDCGRPEWFIQGGKHICRYYGHFECLCGNRWTSAYAWKGETQNCRSCNRASEAYLKEPIQKAEGSKINGEHDQARCGRCRKLGRLCKYG